MALVNSGDQALCWKLFVCDPARCSDPVPEQNVKDFVPSLKVELKGLLPMGLILPLLSGHFQANMGVSDRAFPLFA